jgi:nickel-dependent lactate racemase
VSARTIELGLGAGRVPFTLVPSVEWDILEPASFAEAGFASLSPLVDQLMPDGLAHGTRAALVVPDLTRPAPVREALPVLVEALERRGVPRSHLTLLVAAGTHAAPADAELAHLWSPPAGVEIVVHDARATGVRRGATPEGTPVEIHERYARADWRLTLGGVSLHYLAGFGGGPKMVFPGIASRAGAAANHKRSLGPLPPGGLHPGCGPGLVHGNPVAEDIARATALDPPQAALHVVKQNGSWRYFGGAESQDAARRAVLTRGQVGEPHAYDIVVASLGGAPRDVDVVQSHKALAHAARYARPGAALVLFAATPAGPGSPSFANWLGVSAHDELERRARAQYDLNAQTAISLRTHCKRHTVLWVGSRTPEWVRMAGAIAHEPGPDLDRALAGVSGRGAILPVATEVVPRVV